MLFVLFNFTGNELVLFGTRANFCWYVLAEGFWTVNLDLETAFDRVGLFLNPGFREGAFSYFDFLGKDRGVTVTPISGLPVVRRFRLKWVWFFALRTFSDSNPACLSFSTPFKKASFLDGWRADCCPFWSFSSIWNWNGSYKGVVEVDTVEWANTRSGWGLYVGYLFRNTVVGVVVSIGVLFVGGICFPITFGFAEFCFRSFWVS